MAAAEMLEYWRTDGKVCLSGSIDENKVQLAGVLRLLVLGFALAQASEAET